MTVDETEELTRLMEKRKSQILAKEQSSVKCK